MARLLEKKLQEMTQNWVRQVWAAVKLQSWMRMCLARKRYLNLRTSVCELQDYRNPEDICETYNTIQGFYEITGDQLKLQLDIFFESQICRISDCIPFPIKN